MNKIDIVKRLVDFMVYKKDYKLVKLEQDFNDFWLINTSAEIHLVRIGIDDASTEHVDSVSTLIRGLFGASTPLTQILVSDIHGKQDEEFVYYVNSSKSSFSKISSLFPGIDSVLESKYKVHNLNKNAKGKLALPIIVICVLMYILQKYFSNEYNENISLLLTGVVYKPLIYGAHEWWRLLVSGFVHLSVQHIIFNLLAFYSITPLVERVYGTKKTLFILLASIIVGSWASLLSLSQYAVAAGLSGGIYGLLAALIVYLFKSKLIFVKDVNRQIMLTVGVNLLISFFPDVSLMAHLGGAITGIMVGMLFLYASNEPLKRSLQISLVGLIVFLGIYSVKYDNKTQLDNNVIALNNVYTRFVLPDLGLGGIGNYLDGQLQRYYESEGYR